MKNAVNYLLLLVLLAGLVGLVWHGVTKSSSAGGGAGGPYTANIAVGQVRDMVIFELKVTDSNGKKSRYVKLDSGRRVPPPKLVITDADGEIVHTAQFAYG